LNVFAFAVIHNQLEIARTRLQQFENHVSNRDGPPEQQRFWSQVLQRWVPGRALSLTDLPLDVFEQIPAAAIRSFMVVQQKLMASTDHSYTWEDAANEFTF